MYPCLRHSNMHPLVRRIGYQRAATTNDTLAGTHKYLNEQMNDTESLLRTRMRYCSSMHTNAIVKPLYPRYCFLEIRQRCASHDYKRCYCLCNGRPSLRDLLGSGNFNLVGTIEICHTSRRAASKCVPRGQRFLRRPGVRSHHPDTAVSLVTRSPRSAALVFGIVPVTLTPWRAFVQACSAYCPFVSDAWVGLQIHHPSRRQASTGSLRTL